MVWFDGVSPSMLPDNAGTTFDAAESASGLSNGEWILSDPADVVL